MAQTSVVMIIGDTGNGKSSLAARLQGMLPWETTDPYTVAHTADPGTNELVTATKDWFGEPTYGKVTVVDTPGLGDHRGAATDEQHMASIGRTLKELPVNCVALVLPAQNPRLNYTSRALLKTIIRCLPTKDLDKLTILINRFEHKPSWLTKQRMIYKEDPKERITKNVRDTLKDNPNEDKGPLLELSDAAKDMICNNIFFVDSHYEAGEVGGDTIAEAEAFLEFMRYVKTCKPVDRHLVRETGKIHQELADAESAAKAAEDKLREAEEARDIAIQQRDVSNNLAQEDMKKLLEEAKAAAKASEEACARIVGQLLEAESRAAQAREEASQLRGSSDKAAADAAERRVVEMEIQMAHLQGQLKVMEQQPAGKSGLFGDGLLSAIFPFLKML